MTDFPVRWRGRELSVPVDATQATVGELRAMLEFITGVPSDRQTLLLPGVRSRPASDTPLRELCGNMAVQYPRHAITMLGTPATEELPMHRERDKADAIGKDVVNDLDELAVGPAQPATTGQGDIPQAPPPPPMRPWTPTDVQPFPAGGLPFPEPGRLEAVNAVEGLQNELDSGQETYRGHSQTNGAALRLEEIDEMLSTAVCGDAFKDTHLHADNAVFPVNFLSEPSFMKAIAVAKQRLKMLAVFLVSFETPNSNFESTQTCPHHEDDLSSKSRHLFQHVLANELVADVLNENFVSFAADIGTLDDNGAHLLHRLGLHSVPAVIILSDIGAGIAIVDMFASDFFAGPDATGTISARFLQTLGTYEFAYEAARARRIASSERDEIIFEQDVEFAQAQAQDRERAEHEELERQASENAKAAALAEIQRAIAELPEQPQEGQGAKLAIRLPDGRRVDRRLYTTTTTVKDIFTWCVSLGIPHGSFALSVSFPRKTLTLERDGSCSLEAAGLVPTAALLVDML